MNIRKKKDGTPDMRTNNGGPGRKQGRKALAYPERKSAVSVFVANKYIKKRGGLKAAKLLVLKLLEKD